MLDCSLFKCYYSVYSLYSLVCHCDSLSCEYMFPFFSLCFTSPLYHQINHLFIVHWVLLLLSLMRIFLTLHRLQTITPIRMLLKQKLSTVHRALLSSIARALARMGQSSDSEWGKCSSSTIFDGNASWLRSLVEISLSLSLSCCYFCVTVLVVSYKLMYKCKLNDLNDLLYICCCCRYCCIHHIFIYICAHQHLICPYNKCLYSSAFNIWIEWKKRSKIIAVYVWSNNKPAKSHTKKNKT